MLLALPGALRWRAPRPALAFDGGRLEAIEHGAVCPQVTNELSARAAGVEAGGRTGLASVTTALLFLLCLFIAPLAQSIPAFATGAALLFVACIMARALEDLDWANVTEATPAVVTALAVPLSYSIADGIGLGFITYAAIKLVSGHGRECPAAVYVVAAIFVLKFAFLG